MVKQRQRLSPTCERKSPLLVLEPSSPPFKTSFKLKAFHKKRLVYEPFDWLCVHERSICHYFHPGLRLFGRVSAKIVRPHVGMRGLLFDNGQEG